MSKRGQLRSLSPSPDFKKQVCLPPPLGRIVDSVLISAQNTGRAKTANRRSVSRLDACAAQHEENTPLGQAHQR